MKARIRAKQFNIKGLINFLIKLSTLKKNELSTFIKSIFAT